MKHNWPTLWAPALIAVLFVAKHWYTVYSENILLATTVRQ